MRDVRTVPTKIAEDKPLNLLYLLKSYASILWQVCYTTVESRGRRLKCRHDHVRGTGS